MSRGWVFGTICWWAALSCVPDQVYIANASHSQNAPSAIVEWSVRFEYRDFAQDFCPSQATSFDEFSFAVGTGEHDRKELRAFDKATPIWSLAFSAPVFGLVAVNEETVFVLEGTRPPALHRVTGGKITESRQITDFNEAEVHTAVIDHEGRVLLRDDRAYIYYEPPIGSGPRWGLGLIQSPSTEVTSNEGQVAVMGCSSVRSESESRCANLTVFDSSRSVAWDFNWSEEQTQVVERIYIGALRLSAERGVWLTGHARRSESDDMNYQAYVANVQAPGKLGWQSYVRSDSPSASGPIVNYAAFAATVLRLEAAGTLRTSGRPDRRLQAGKTLVEYGPQGIRTQFLGPGLSQVLAALDDGVYLVAVRTEQACWLQRIRFL